MKRSGTILSYPKTLEEARKQVAAMLESKDFLSKRILALKNYRQMLFLTAYRRFDGNLTQSLDIAKIEQDVFEKWLEDKRFSKILQACEQELNDKMRSLLVALAREKKNLGAITFYLRKRHPQFMDKPSVFAMRADGKDGKIELVIQTTADEKDFVRLTSKPE